MDNTKMDSAPHQAGRYEIRLDGLLALDYEEWFDGFHITQESGDTFLQGEIADQSALHGLLRRIRDLGVPIISIRRISAHPSGGDQ